jgi:hypothetical protein
MPSFAVLPKAVAFACCASLLSVSVSSVSVSRAETPGMTLGPVELKSIGPMTFTPTGVLLVGDPKTATVHAIDPEDSRGVKTGPQIDDITAALRSSLGLSGEIRVGELAVHPSTGNSFLTIAHGGQVQLVKITGDNTVTPVNLDKVPHASKALPNAPEDKDIIRRGRNRNPRLQSITDLAFYDGKVMVTGLAAGEVPSRVLELPFPFADNSVATSVEIFHAAHGRVETPAIQTFLPLTIEGQPSLLAGFTCTPLVRFPVNALDGSEKVRGTTVAELGNRNRPLDMVVYEKDGKTSILMSNTARGMMKISTEGITEREGLSERVSGGGTAGQPFETIESLAGVRQMDKLDNARAVTLVESDGTLALTTIQLP